MSEILYLRQAPNLPNTGSAHEVNVENNEKELRFDTCIVKPARSIMSLKNAAIYWNYKNVITGKNDHVMDGATKISFEEGYWTFDMIEEKLGKQSIKLEANEHNNTCKIYSETQNLNLKKFGELLGFPENEIVNSGTRKTSPSVVDVNKGLRYVNINCNIVNTAGNIDTDGHWSYALTSLPIPSNQLLNSTVTKFKGLNGSLKITNGQFNRILFNVDTNIEDKVDMSLLLELYIN